MTLIFHLHGANIGKRTLTGNTLHLIRFWKAFSVLSVLRVICKKNNGMIVEFIFHEREKQILKTIKYNVMRN